jgi:hypothetical protein
MLEHAKAMGFEVRRQAYGEVTPAAKKAAVKTVTAKKAPAKQVAVKKPAAKPAVPKQPTTQASTKAVAANATPAKRLVPAKKPAPAKKAAAEAPVAAPKGAAVATRSAVKAVAAKAAVQVSGSAATLKKLTDSLRKMGDKRPTKPASLWRSLKSFLGPRRLKMPWRWRWLG